MENEKIAEIMEQIHAENPDKGYRRIKDDLAHDHNLTVNEKRVLRICRSLDIRSTIIWQKRSEIGNDRTCLRDPASAFQALLNVRFPKPTTLAKGGAV